MSTKLGKALTYSKRRSKSLERGFFIAICHPTGDKCHLSPNWRQMAIKSTVSNDFRSAFVDCLSSVFDCRLSGVLRTIYSKKKKTSSNHTVGTATDIESTTESPTQNGQQLRAPFDFRANSLLHQSMLISHDCLSVK